MLGAILAAAVVTGSPSPTAATGATATAQAAASAAPKDPDPLICRSEAGSGTRLTHKVCFRKSELAQRRLEDRQALDRMGAMRPPEGIGMGMMGPPR